MLIHRHIKLALGAAILAVTLHTSDALACADLPNICEATMYHNQMMNDLAAEAAMANSIQQQEEAYANEPPEYSEEEWREWATPSGAMSGVSASYDLFTSDPKYQKMMNGEWIYPGSSLKAPPKDLPCTALYVRKGSGVLLLSPPPGEEMASMIFFGPDVPRPASNQKIQVTLKQSDGPAQTTNVMNIPFHSGFGAIIFAVPTMKLLVDNMLDNEDFQVILNNKTIISLAWKDGLTAKSELTQCMASKQ